MIEEVSRDSAGIPFGGRTLPRGGFDDDRGDADAALAQALQRPDEVREVFAALRAARLLVPIAAHPGKDHTDMATMTLVAPDGRRAMPVFSSYAALTAWNPQARPVPVTAARAAQAAVSEGCEVMVLDLASDSAWVVRTSMLWALAQQQLWLPADEDPQVRRAVAAAITPMGSIRSHALSLGSDGTLTVTLDLDPGLTAADVQAIATSIGERVARDGEARARIDAIAFVIR